MWFAHQTELIRKTIEPYLLGIKLGASLWTLKHHLITTSGFINSSSVKASARQTHHITVMDNVLLLETRLVTVKMIC